MSVRLFFVRFCACCTFLLFFGCVVSPRYQSLVLEKAEIGPGGVSATWLGTAGILLSDGDTEILFDPYVSRNPYGWFPILSGQPIKSREAAVIASIRDLGMRNVEAIFVSHAHFDHSLDVPNFAKYTNARVLGSQSVQYILEGSMIEGLKEVMVIEDGGCITFGKFKIVFRLSDHGKPFLGQPFAPDNIEEALKPGANAYDYRLGETFAAHVTHPNGSLIYNASAGWKETTFKGLKADVAIMALAGRTETKKYIESVAGEVGASRIIPVHFDYFLGEQTEEVRMFPNVQFSHFVDVAEKTLDGVTVDALPLSLIHI